MSSPDSSSLLPSNWLITGGCGFLGIALMKRLIKEGVPYIRVLDNLTVGTKEDLAEVCDFEEVKTSSLLTPNSSRPGPPRWT